MSWFILGLFLVLMILGIPVAVALGSSCFVAIMLYDTSTIASAVKLMYSSMNSFTMVAVPLFILAGLIMEKGGVAQEIFDFCSNLVGWIFGGLGHVAILCGLIFAGMSGSSVADIASVGVLNINAMTRAGFPKDYATAVNLISSMLATVIPPSILMVVCASVAQVSIGSALFAGVIPGIIIGFIFMIYNFLYCKKHNIGERVPFDRKKLGSSFIHALPALLVPIILLGGMYTGYFTSTEAAAICVTYTTLVAMFVYKKLKLRDIPTILCNCAKSTGTILFVAIAAKPAGQLFTLDGLPATVAAGITSISSNPTIVMILIFFLLIIIGMFMDATAAIYIFTPILLPAAVGVGVDPLFFVVFMVIALAFGLITPPVGVCLYAAVNVTGLSMERIAKATIPWLILTVCCLFVFIFIPQLITGPIAVLFG